MKRMHTSRLWRCWPGLLLAGVWLCTAVPLLAQVEVSHQSDWFYVEPGTDVHIKGSLISLPGNADPISNLGDMYISDSVTCDGDNLMFGTTPDTLTAHIYLNGAALQTFTGSQNMRFGNLHIQNSFDSLQMFNTVEIYNYLQMDNGNIDVGADTLDLLHTGRIVAETNAKRLFTGAYGRIHMNRPLILNNTYPDIAGIGLGMTIDGNLGTDVSIFRGNFPQPNVANGSIERFYFFQPQLNGEVTDPVSRYWDGNELEGNDESDLQFYQSNTSGVNWTLAGGTADTLADVVNGTGVDFIMTNTRALTLAEGNCDSLPYIEFPVDTIPICGPGGNTWLVPNGITGMSSEWSNGTLNQDSIQVFTPGTYEVIVTDVQGCPNADSVEVVMAPVPVADFHITPVCIGDSSLFQNQSAVSSGSLSYNWDLNDVYTSGPDTTSATDPGIVYTNPGQYTVSLTATSGLGCSDIFTATATVLPYPVADFSIPDHCEDSVLTFANSSSVTPAAGLTYYWDFGNGDTSIATVPNYGFPAAGTHLISLEATSNGCSSTTTKSITIHPNPIADFVTNDACLGSQTQLTNMSSISSGGMSFVWNLAPGQNSTLTDPTYVFPGSGTQSVTLTTTSGFGCIHDTTMGVTVNALPQPSFAAAATCQGDLMQFTNTSPATSSFQWDFSGEGNSAQYNPQFAFATAGTKTISLVETDLNGCVDSVLQTVVSKPAPVAAFSTTGNCEGENIQFLNTSSTPSGSMSYQWDFGDLTTSSLPNPIHSYSTDANFPVRLIAENNGCFDTLTLSVIVDSVPLLNLGGVVATCDSQYIFDAQNSGSAYLWSTGSTNQAITATFNGNYWVAVTNAEGCQANDTVSLTLNSIVTPQLGADSLFCDVANLDAGYPGAVYFWSTGDTTQTISPANSGSYWVEVTDQNGCVGSDTILTTIVAATQPTLGPDLDRCDGATELLDPVNLGVSYLWSSGDTSATLSVANSGTYWVELTDANGCISRDSVDLLFHPNPMVDLGADSTYCDSASFDLSQANVAYLWSSGGTGAVEVFSASGTFSVQVTDTLFGCQNADTVTLVIGATPQVALGADTILCSGSDIVLDAGNPGNTYTWNVGQSGQTLTAASSGVYAVDVMGPEGCVGTDSIDIVVGAPIHTDLGNDFTLCQGQTVTVSSPIFGGNYAWYHDGILLSNVDRNLVVGDFGTYIAVVTDSVGCIATDTIESLQTGSEIHAEFLVSTLNHFAGDTLQFVNLSYPGSFTSYWSFGDGAFSIGEDPTHVYFAAGDYVASLEVTNGICSSTLTKTLTIVPKVVIQPEDPEETVINDFVETVLYPNPNNGDFTLEVGLLKEGELTVQCIDMRGKVLFSELHTGKDFTLRYEHLNISSGIYLLNLRVSGRSETIKFIKH